VQRDLSFQITAATTPPGGEENNRNRMLLLQGKGFKIQGSRLLVFCSLVTTNTSRPYFSFQDSLNFLRANFLVALFRIVFR